MFDKKTICVFGGTGTIGSLIVEELMKYDCIIRVFCNSENELWEKRNEWNEKFKDTEDFEKVRYLYGDIRDLERVNRALKGVDYVFNCAAMKHVPYCEYNPLEAVKTNVLGLNNVIQGCIENNVKKLLHVSTDKAVEPSTVMGATKMIGEKILQMRWQQNPDVQMVCVRLGNVWASRGSIMELVKECRKQEKPIPITDKKMKRFFMTPDEVCSFIFESFREGGYGEIFIPKLKQVNILEVIRGEVGIEYPFEEIGIRKGEKLEESLISSEELRLDTLEETRTKWIIHNDQLKNYLSRNLMIEKATMKDFDGYYYLRCDPNNIFWTGYKELPDYNLLRVWFENILKTRKIYLAKIQGRVVGYLYLIPSGNGEIELSYAIHSFYVNKGYGKMLIKFGVRKAQKQGVQTIVMKVKQGNIASINVIKSTGFKDLGLIEDYLHFKKNLINENLLERETV